MNPADAARTVVDAITAIAPDTDPDSVPPDADLFEELELDSIDLIGIVTAISERTGVTIPERDYPRLQTMAGFVAYLTERTSEEP